LSNSFSRYMFQILWRIFAARRNLICIFLALVVLHCALWLFQSAFWHVAEQYRVFVFWRKSLQPEHVREPGAKHLAHFS
jgi:hypothetical protein